MALARTACCSDLLPRLRKIEGLFLVKYPAFTCAKLSWASILTVSGSTSKVLPILVPTTILAPFSHHAKPLSPACAPKARLELCFLNPCIANPQWHFLEPKLQIWPDKSFKALLPGMRGCLEDITWMPKQYNFKVYGDQKSQLLKPEPL